MYELIRELFLALPTAVILDNFVILIKFFRKESQDQ